MRKPVQLRCQIFVASPARRCSCVPLARVSPRQRALAGVAPRRYGCHGCPAGVRHGCKAGHDDPRLPRRHRRARGSPRARVARLAGGQLARGGAAVGFRPRRRSRRRRAPPQRPPCCVCARRCRLLRRRLQACCGAAGGGCHGLLAPGARWRPGPPAATRCLLRPAESSADTSRSRRSLHRRCRAAHRVSRSAARPCRAHAWRERIRRASAPRTGRSKHSRSQAPFSVATSCCLCR